MAQRNSAKLASKGWCRQRNNSRFATGGRRIHLCGKTFGSASCSLIAHGGLIHGLHLQKNTGGFILCSVAGITGTKSTDARRCQKQVTHLASKPVFLLP